MTPPSPEPASAALLRPDRPVALDASLWDAPTTGIGQYGRCLARALEARGLQVLKLGAERTGDDPRGRLGATAYALGALHRALARTRPALFHALGNFNLPLRALPGVPYVLTVHDLIPLLLPETASRAYRWQFRLWLGRSAHVAARIVCVSARTRDDLLARHPEVAARVRVVHSGVDHVLEAPEDAGTRAFLDALALPERFALYAGSLDARKNVALVLDALERLHARGRPAPLVLVGQRWFGSGPVERRVARLREDGHDVRVLGYQEPAVLYGLMRRAGCFLFPSRYEGFGLPPLEAMRLGTPAVVSTAGSLPEVCGTAALAVAPDDAKGLAAAMDRLLRDPAERQEWAERGLAHARAFTWERCARETAEVYAEALAGG